MIPRGTNPRVRCSVFLSKTTWPPQPHRKKKRTPTPQSHQLHRDAEPAQIRSSHTCLFMPASLCTSRSPSRSKSSSPSRQETPPLLRRFLQQGLHWRPALSSVPQSRLSVMAHHVETGPRKETDCTWSQRSTPEGLSSVTVPARGSGLATLSLAPHVAGREPLACPWGRAVEGKAHPKGSIAKSNGDFVMMTFF